MRKLLKIIVVMSLLSAGAGFASRSFSGTDKLQNTSASALHPTLPITWMAWVFLPGTPGAFGAVLVNGPDTGAPFYGFGLAISINAGFCSPASTPCLDAMLSTDGDNKGGTLSNSVWHCLLATYDGANIEVYVDGTGTTTATSGAITYPNATIDIGTDAFGNVTNAYVAHVAAWSVKLSAGEIAALSNRVNPGCVRRSSLVFYYPIWGVDSPEPEIGGSKVNLTVTGTATHNNPPVGKPCSVR